MIYVALTALVVLLAACCVSNKAYRNGFWDGVLWERERDGRVRPPHEACESGDCTVCAGLYRPGSESPYHSKPDPSWHGWAALEAGARDRDKAGVEP